MTSTKFSVAGRSPLQAVEALLADPQVTPAALDEHIENLCGSVKGPILKPLERYRRIKLRNGFFSRIVWFGEKEKGIEGIGGPIGFRPTRAEMVHFHDLFAGDPA